MIEAVWRLGYGVWRYAAAFVVALKFPYDLIRTLHQNNAKHQTQNAKQISFLQFQEVQFQILKLTPVELEDPEDYLHMPVLEE